MHDQRSHDLRLYDPANAALADQEVTMYQTVSNSNWSPTFGTITGFFNGQGYTNTKTLGFYSGDYWTCDDCLQNEAYHCTG